MNFYHSKGLLITAESRYNEIANGLWVHLYDHRVAGYTRIAPIVYVEAPFERDILSYRYYLDHEQIKSGDAMNFAASLTNELRLWQYKEMNQARTHQIVKHFLDFYHSRDRRVREARNVSYEIPKYADDRAYLAFVSLHNQFVNKTHKRHRTIWEYGISPPSEF